MVVVVTNYTQQEKQSSQTESSLQEQLQDVLSGIISTLDVYDVVDDGTNFSVINLKNDQLLYENINLRLVANVVASALNTGEPISEHAVSKLLEHEQRAVSKMVETAIYEDLIENAKTLDQETLYEIKLQEADLKCKNAMEKLLHSAHNIISQ
jgi:(2Fe-2S) ferredoxin